MDGASLILGVQRSSIAGPEPAHDCPAIGIDDAAALEDASRRSAIGIGRSARDRSQSGTADHAGHNGGAVVARGVVALSQPVWSVAVALITAPSGAGLRGRSRLNGHGTDKDKVRSHRGSERNAHSVLQRAELP
jgi:hypothetical protein